MKPLIRIATLAGILLALLAVLAQEHDLERGLVAYWPLDEVQGTKTPELDNG